MVDKLLRHLQVRESKTTSKQPVPAQEFGVYRVLLGAPMLE